LQATDAEALDQAISAWLVTRSETSTAASLLRVIAIDGKSARGARGPDGRAVGLLAAFDQASGMVMGQTVVDAKSNEITAFAPLLGRIDIAGVIVTADALHTQHRHADYLASRGAHYVLTVKGNQPSLHRQLPALPWTQIPTVERTCDKGHGRIESRTLKLAAVPRRDRIPPRPPRHPAHPPTPVTDQPRVAHRDRLRDHRHDLVRHPRRPTRRSNPRALEHRKPPALDPRRRLRRRPQPNPHRSRASSHGHPAQPRRQPPPTHRRSQHRHRLPPHQPPPQPRPPATHITDRSTLPRPW
jgi:predicted transposase YbfD/YdcC